MVICPSLFVSTSLYLSQWEATERKVVGKEHVKTNSLMFNRLVIREDLVLFFPLLYSFRLFYGFSDLLIRNAMQVLISIAASSFSLSLSLSLPLLIVNNFTSGSVVLCTTRGAK